MVNVLMGRWQEKSYLELLDCEMDTTILEVKQRAVAAALASHRQAGLEDPPPGPAAADHEMRFMDYICQNQKALRDYGICHDWIMQVTGFTLRPTPLNPAFVDSPFTKATPSTTCT
jgi:hypothetical protein